jgi:hypothetical protein
MGAAGPGRGREQALNTYVGQLAYSDPPTALQWVQDIADPNMQSQTLQFIARQWMRTDPAAATVWINNSSLPNGVKAGLLQTPPSGETVIVR